jgi:hypothetical protein
LAQAKQKCVHGHELTKANTYVRPSGKRQCRICRTAHSRNRRRKDGNIKLPMEPYAQWVADLVGQHGVIQTCYLTGLRERQIWKALNREAEGKGPPTVRIDTVDRALQTVDGFTTLRDLYPELYEETDSA